MTLAPVGMLTAIYAMISAAGNARDHRDVLTGREISAMLLPLAEPWLQAREAVRTIQAADGRDGVRVREAAEIQWAMAEHVRPQPPSTSRCPRSRWTRCIRPPSTSRRPCRITRTGLRRSPRRTPALSPERFTVDLHLAVGADRDHRLVIRELAVDELAGEGHIIALDPDMALAELQFEHAVAAFQQALQFLVRGRGFPAFGLGRNLDLQGAGAGATRCAFA